MSRYNSDLANGLGNLASRTLTMIGQYRAGVVPEGSEPQIAALANDTIRSVQDAFERFEFSKALEAGAGLSPPFMRRATATSAATITSFSGRHRRKAW